MQSKPIMIKLPKSDKEKLKKIAEVKNETMTDLIKEELRKLLIENNINTF